MKPESGAAPGWYGKISSLGDFASRRLEPELIERCDDWLSRSMSASHAQLADDWLQVYLSAPVWRFAWAPGVVDGRWWFGVLMPSCDNVGRYFPLIVMQAREAPPMDRIGLDHLDLWWTRVAEAAVRSLQDEADLQAFESELTDTPPWPCAPTMGSMAHTPFPDRVRVTPSHATGLVDLAGTWAADEFVARLSGCSLWWPIADSTTASAVTLAQGLPDPQRFADLLAGRW